MSGMGSACSTPETRALLKQQYSVNKKIDRQLRKDMDDDLGNQKLLLLGTGECGKSTILKQMQILHKNGYTDSELNEKKCIVYSNVLVGMSTMINAIDKFMYTLTSSEIEMDARRILAVVESGKDILPFSPDVYKSLKNLWVDNTIKRVFARRSEFQLGDSVQYFLNDLDRIYSEKYKPTLDDILHLRVPTAGVVQVQFPIKGCLFRVFDVGGQRSERRKWIHLFDDVHAIIFICAVNEYDQMLQEDSKTNRMQESMDLFSQICNSKWFMKSSMILFLNKKDLFAEKIKSVPITTLFKNFKGENTYQCAMAYITDKFQKMNEYKRNRTIYVHETCATDTDQVQLVIDSVVDTVIGKNLRGTGME